MVKILNSEAKERYKAAISKLKGCGESLKSKSQSIVEPDEAQATGATVCELACAELAVALIVKELACGQSGA